MDKNFDKLVDRFERRVYGGLKGKIRLAVIWRDLLERLAWLEQRKGGPLEILDAGGGLAQISVQLAARGHRILYNDLSAAMLDKARSQAVLAGVDEQFRWHHGAYQSLATRSGEFDIILCHALLEWLAEPELLLPKLRGALADGGLLSLCYYNPAGKTYRNLVRGNFDLLNRSSSYRSDSGSLTPNSACDRDVVLQWLQQAGLQVIGESGIRVFHDYVVERRGGHQCEDDVLAMELRYSELAPYKWLGRYQHIIATTTLAQQDANGT
ncbi:MAG: methyltransferase domain-containing protein [Pseudomonadales bacterium]